MLKIGIIGNDKALITEYSKIINTLPNVILAGITSMPLEPLSDTCLLDEVLKTSDIICIVSPAGKNSITYILKNFKHVFLDNFFSLSVEDFQYLSNTANEADVAFRIANTSSLYPIKHWTEQHQLLPKYVEIQQHDKSKSINSLLFANIGIAIKLARANIRKIHSIGMNTLSSGNQVAAIQLEFSNGCVADINLNTITTQPLHKLSIYYPQGYDVLDLLEFKENNFQQKAGNTLHGEKFNNLNQEITDFINSMGNNYLHTKYNCVDEEILSATLQIKKKLAETFVS